VQSSLAQEAHNLAQEKLAKAAVFAHLLNKAGDAMDRAGERAQERFDQAQARLEEIPDAEAALDLAAETSADEETQQAQREALRRLDQLLEALKEGAAGGPRPQQQPQQEGKPMPGGGSGQPPGGEGVSSLAQMKALRALQQEVNERTERFARRHPNVSKLTDKQRAELQGIKQEQQEVADLFQQLTAAEEPKEEKP
jgi:hypothetical protein